MSRDIFPPDAGPLDASNCFGCLWSARLDLVCKAALTAGPWTVRRCDRSAYDGHWRLNIELPQILELESDGPLKDGSYLFNGAAETKRGLGVHTLSDISSRLTTAGVPHTLELHAPNGEIVRRFHHQWPETQTHPVCPLWAGVS